MIAIDLIADERKRQICQEGYSSQHDDTHQKGEIIEAAAILVSVAQFQSNFGTLTGGKKYLARTQWPWEEHTLKLSDDPIRNLVKAAALIAAEIDRLQRKKSGDCNAQSRPSDDNSHSSPGTSPGVS